MRCGSFIILTLLLSVSLLGQEPTEPAVAASVTCKWDQTRCDQTLLISGAFPSVIHITDIPANATSLTVAVQTRERQGRTVLASPVGVFGGEATVTVFKQRLLGPIYKSGSRSFLSSIATLAKDAVARISGDADNDTPPEGSVAIRGDTAEITLEMVVATTTDGTNIPPRSVTIPLQYQKWRVESGGFYTWSWARNEELVTKTITVNNEARTQVLERRIGDRLGPSTGVTFVFYKSDYPELGLEFGTATSSDTPTSYYFGTVGRLLGIGDRVSVTLSGGLSRVSVRRFPGAIPDGPEKGIFLPDDPRLTGLQKHVFKPYVALGFGVTLGASSQASQEAK